MNAFNKDPIFISLVLVTALSLLGSKFEMLGSFQCQLLPTLTFLAFQPQNNLTGGLSLLVEDGLSLTSESHLLRIITTLSLSEIRRLTSLVLCYLMNSVLAALLRCAESFTLFWNIDHGRNGLFDGGGLNALEKIKFTNGEFSHRRNSANCPPVHLQYYERIRVTIY